MKRATVYTAAVSRSRSPRMERSSDNAGEAIGNSERVIEGVFKGVVKGVFKGVVLRMW